MKALALAGLLVLGACQAIQEDGAYIVDRGGAFEWKFCEVWKDGEIVSFTDMHHYKTECDKGAK